MPSLSSFRTAPGDSSLPCASSNPNPKPPPASPSPPDLSSKGFASPFDPGGDPLPRSSNGPRASKEVDGAWREVRGKGDRSFKGPKPSAPSSWSFKPGSQPKSWADVVSPAAIDDDLSLSFFPEAVKDDKVHILNSDFASEEVDWKNCLLVYALGRRPYYVHFVAFLKRFWKPVGDFKVFTRENGFFICQFAEDSDFSRVLKGGPYLFEGRLLVIKKYSNEFSLDRDLLSKVPVWVRLPSLSLRLWNKNSIGKLLSAVGRPLHLDPLTARRVRLSFARVFVEISAKSKRITSIPILFEDGTGYDQPIEYEYLPPVCENCGCFGHKSTVCSIPMSKKWVPKSATFSKSVEGVESVADSVILNVLPVLEDGDYADDSFTDEMRNLDDAILNEAAGVDSLLPLTPWMNGLPKDYYSDWTEPESGCESDDQDCSPGDNAEVVGELSQATVTVQDQNVDNLVSDTRVNCVLPFDLEEGEIPCSTMPSVGSKSGKKKKKSKTGVDVLGQGGASLNTEVGTHCDGGSVGVSAADVLNNSVGCVAVDDVDALVGCQTVPKFTDSYKKSKKKAVPNVTPGSAPAEVAVVCTPAGTGKSPIPAVAVCAPTIAGEDLGSRTPFKQQPEGSVNVTTSRATGGRAKSAASSDRILRSNMSKQLNTEKS